MRRISSRMLMAGSLLFGVIGIGLSARAQGEAAPEEDSAAERGRTRAEFITDEQFDEWFFGPLGGAEKAAARFESQLTARIGELDRMYGLTPEQKKKLEVAGKRDIRRLFDSIREKKIMLDRAGRNMGELRAVVWELQVFRSTFVREFRFDGGSLLAKTLKKNLVAEQYSRYNKEFYRSRVERIVSSSDLGHRLSNERRHRFADLIADETPPLKRYGEHDAHAVMFQASKLPEDKLRPIFGADELRRLHETFREARAFEKTLLDSGYLDGDRPESGNSSPAGDEKPKAVDAQRARPSPVRRQYVEE